MSVMLTNIDSDYTFSTNRLLHMSDDFLSLISPAFYHHDEQATRLTSMHVLLRYHYNTIDCEAIFEVDL